MQRYTDGKRCVAAQPFVPGVLTPGIITDFPEPGPGAYGYARVGKGPCDYECIQAGEYLVFHAGHWGPCILPADEFHAHYKPVSA